MTPRPLVLTDLQSSSSQRRQLYTAECPRVRGLVCKFNASSIQKLKMRFPSFTIPLLLRLLSLAGVTSAAGASGGDKASASMIVGFALSTSATPSPCPTSAPTSQPLPLPVSLGLDLNLDLDFFLQFGEKQLRLPITSTMPL